MQNTQVSQQQMETITNAVMDNVKKVHKKVRIRIDNEYYQNLEQMLNNAILNMPDATPRNIVVRNGQVQITSTIQETMNTILACLANWHAALGIELDNRQQFFLMEGVTHSLVLDKSNRNILQSLPGISFWNRFEVTAKKEQTLQRAA